MKRCVIDWIWNIRGSLALAPGQTGDEAFQRLDPLFQQANTSHERSSDTLIFQKKRQAPQDKMSIFDAGVLKVRGGVSGAVLHYRLKSHALLLCFLAPLLFLGFAQATVAIGQFEATSAKPIKKKDGEKKDMALPQHPIDAFLGAPVPEKPKVDKKEKTDEEGDKPSPTPAYVFAALFAALYLVGRILEDRLIKSLFRKTLAGAQ